MFPLPKVSVKLILKLGWLSLAAYLLLAPEQAVHHLFEVIHVLYEMAAFSFEEFLHHVFHLNKFQSQLIVFYLTCLISLYLTYRLWRLLPKLLESLKNYLHYQLTLARMRLIQVWQSLRSDQKVKLILFQLIGLIGTALLLLS